MNGPVVQMVALTLHGNAHLQGREPDPFFPENSTCQFCEKVRFVRLVEPLLPRPREVPAAETPQAWMRLLRASGCRGLRLAWAGRTEYDQNLAGFVGGGGTWVIQAVFGGDRVQSWYPRWEVGNREAPDRRIWRVTYGAAVMPTRLEELARPDLERVRSRLEGALREVHTFSSAQSCGAFTGLFSTALACMESPEAPSGAYHKDLLPEGYGQGEAGRILEACQTAWVFGGMGSWNDMDFSGETQKDYERVSDGLFQALTFSIAACATDSYYW